jgi:recombination protein RecA
MARPKKVEDTNTVVENTRKQKLQELKEKYNKQFKKAVVQMYDEDDDLTLERLSSGILSLDLILGKGSNGYGWAKGRVHEIYGPESTGKTTVVIQTMIAAQQAGLTVGLVDAEHAFSPSYAQELGLKIDELLISQPETAEEGYNVALLMIEDGIELVVIDSVAAMAAEVEVEGDMEDQQMGGTAKMNNKFMRKVVPLLGEKNGTLILINQLREKIGGYGNPETTTGGRGIKFACSTRLDIRRAEDVEEAGQKVGHIIRAKTIKNKTSAPQQTALFRLDWGVGFNKAFCLVSQGLEKNVIEKGGAWYKFDGRQWQGKEALIKDLNDDSELTAKLTEAILEA